MTPQMNADDVVMPKQLWRNQVNNDIRLVDIDFIHGDIRGRSYKK